MPTSSTPYRSDTGFAGGLAPPPLRAPYVSSPHQLHSYRNEPVLAAFHLTTRSDAVLLTREGEEDAVSALTCLGVALAGIERGGTVVGMVEGGRIPHPIVEVEGGDRVVVKEYRRGGAMRHLNRARYFFGNRAFDELIATERARSAGVRTPEVLVAAERRRLIGYTAYLATRWIPRGTHGEAWLRRATPAGRAAVLAEAGRQIALMHTAGIAHPDLNLRNLLVVWPPDTPRPTVYLLDFDRARLFDSPVPATRRADDLMRLGRSARKLDLALEDERGWDSLRRGYGAAWPLTTTSST